MFHVRPSSGEPIYQQLVRQVAHAVTTGALKPGDRLPTVRDLATQLAINPNTVARAYRELEHAGLLAGSFGKGTFVTFKPPGLLPAERRRRLLPAIEHLIAEARTLGFADRELLALVRATFERRPGGPAEEERR